MSVGKEWPQISVVLVPSSAYCMDGTLIAESSVKMEGSKVRNH